MKTRFFLMVWLTALAVACSQKQSVVELPATAIDVETLGDSLDYDMDISHLGLSDLYVLQAAPAAQRGYPFKDAYLRGIYGTTTWYDSLMWKFDETTEFSKVEDRDGESWRDYYYRAADELHVLDYNEQEQQFISRLQQRQEALRQQNFDAPADARVNIANLLNPAQVTSLDTLLATRLARNGFAIVAAGNEQLFHVYEQNDYRQFPSFVTTDLFLQLYHLYFDCLLRDAEQQRLVPLLSRFCQELAKAVAAGSGTMDGEVNQWLATYCSVANALMTGREPHDGAALTEYRQVMKGEDSLSDFLGYRDAMFAYSLFSPRGHYTRNDTLQHYFRTMMWLQAVPFQTDRETDMQKAFALARLVGSTPVLTQLYDQLTRPMTWLMGQPDDVSIMQVWQVMQQEPDFARCCDKVNALAEKQTRIRPKFQHTSRNKVRLMPQRYQPDAEVLQEMVDYDSTPTTRATPKGLDVMAAMGVGAAEQLLRQESQQWKDYWPQMDKMKQRMGEIDWQQTVATQWLQALKTVTATADGQPYFMATEEWGLKSLNAALASWAELKHDAILYAKQPFGAECGGAGPPDPVVKGYVEPNTAFWQKAIDLIDATAKVLTEQHLATAKVEEATRRIGEEARFLLRISEKELRGEEPTDEEYDQLKCIGATFENISLDLIRQPDQYLMGWDDIQGTDRKVALVADVYTANADNNPDKSILYEAVGLADEIYVVVEIGGYLYLTRGAVLSYRELTLPVSEPRLTDERWQQMIEQEPRRGVPQWMDRIIVPVKQKPEANEKIFYSSGC